MSNIMIFACSARDIHPELMHGCVRCGQFNWGANCLDTLCDLRAEAMGHPVLEAEFEMEYREEVMGHIWPDVDHDSVVSMIGDEHIVFVNPSELESMQSAQLMWEQSWA